ncbi:MAG: Bax inhibitor-1/YccA family protein [Alphaproteobacteria bacterium]|nr:Bax inhibitor-1/YccA family protein [Alphaproteobacteria bacterium]
MKDKVTSFYKDAAAAVSLGLRNYMLKVFTHMSIGLAFTAIVSFAISTSPALMRTLFATGLQWIVLLAPLGIVLFLSARIAHLSSEAATAWFYAYSASVGASLAPIFLVYTGESIVTTFFIASSMFLSMVIYGYTTEKDLTGVGSFLIMGLFGVVIASIVNIFVRSSVTSLIISIVGVLVFTGLTAFDAQRIKSMYFDGDAQDITEKKAIFGALSLYMDFINLFLYILRMLGARRD